MLVCLGPCGDAQSAHVECRGLERCGGTRSRRDLHAGRGHRAGRRRGRRGAGRASDDHGSQPPHRSFGPATGRVLRALCGEAPGQADGPSARVPVRAGRVRFDWGSPRRVLSACASTPPSQGRRSGQARRPSPRGGDGQRPRRVDDGERKGQTSEDRGGPRQASRRGRELVASSSSGGESMRIDSGGDAGEAHQERPRAPRRGRVTTNAELRSVLGAHGRRLLDDTCRFETAARRRGG